MEYTVPLALVDFLPVLFTAFGMFYLVRMIAHINEAQGKIAAIGAILVVFGGLMKAIWKLLIASSGTDIRWMDEGMFAWMSSGYTLLVWSVWQTVRAVQGKKTFNTWLIPSLVAAFALAGSYYLYGARPEATTWKIVLLSLMVLASVITSLLLIVFSFRQKLQLAGVLFVINLIIIFVMNGLARIPEQTIALQWIEETINSVSWLSFAIATKQVFEYTRKTFGVN